MFFTIEIWMTFRDDSNDVRWNPRVIGFGILVAVDTGKRLNQAKSLRERVDKVANVNEFNRKEDEELNRQIQNAGNNHRPVRAPWLRKRN